jgi:hypothetical protein
MRLAEVIDVSKLVTVNSKLNPKLWNDGELDAQVKAKLLEIAQAFEEFIGIDLNVVDYTVTGSNANYTWTKFSDLDLHLIVKGQVTDEARELFTAKKALWTEIHDIKIKGMPVECYVQGSEEPHHSTGVYSLVKNTWLAEPKKVKPKIDDAAVRAKTDSAVHDIETALLKRDLETLRKVKKKITTMRKAGLERAGEWAVENLVFKVLRNIGLIDQLTEVIAELEDQELSLEQTQPLD